MQVLFLSLEEVIIVAGCFEAEAAAAALLEFEEQIFPQAPATADTATYRPSTVKPIQ